MKERERVMKRSEWTALTVILLAGAAAASGLGCETRVSVIEPNGQNQSAVDGVPDVAYGTCLVEPPLPPDYVDYFGTARCQSTLAPGGGHGPCAGWTVGVPTANGGGACTVYASCEHGCTTAADCPVPGTGTARPACSAKGSCELRCDEASTCPNGLSCVEVPDSTSSGTEPSRLCASTLQAAGAWTSNTDGGGGGTIGCPDIEPR